MRRRLFPKATDLDVSVGEGTHSRRLGTDSENDAFHLLRPAQTRRHKEINFGTRRDPGKAGDGYVDEMEMQSCQTIGEESKSPDISGGRVMLHQSSPSHVCGLRFGAKTGDFWVKHMASGVMPEANSEASELPGQNTGCPCSELQRKASVQGMPFSAKKLRHSVWWMAKKKGLANTYPPPINHLVRQVDVCGEVKTHQTTSSNPKYHNLEQAT